MKIQTHNILLFIISTLLFFMLMSYNQKTVLEKEDTTVHAKNWTIELPEEIEAAGDLQQLECIRTGERSLEVRFQSIKNEKAGEATPIRQSYTRGDYQLDEYDDCLVMRQNDYIIGTIPYSTKSQVWKMINNVRNNQ